MSGRLIILPKKSYAPWKPENVERVLRDERLERERIEREEGEQLKTESLGRVRQLQLLKKKRARVGVPVRAVVEETDKEHGVDWPSDDDNDNDDGGGASAAMRHVNLFEAEEKEMAERAVSGTDTSGSKPSEFESTSGEITATNTAKPGGILPLYLGGDEAARRRGDKAKPFYLQNCSADGYLESNNQEQEHNNDAERRKDDRLKARMDPMQQFTSKGSDRNTRSSTHAVGKTSNPCIPTGNDTSSKRKHPFRRSSSSNSSTSSSSDRDRHDRKRKKQQREPNSKSKRGREKRSNSSSRSRRRDKRGSTRAHGTDEGRRDRSPKDRHGRKNKVTCSSESLSVLRRRRQLREQKEAERSFMVRLEEQSIASAHSTSTDRKYQDQYNPSLSRR